MLIELQGLHFVMFNIQDGPGHGERGVWRAIYATTYVGVGVLHTRPDRNRTRDSDSGQVTAHTTHATQEHQHAPWNTPAGVA